jgi:hypothetical protein
MMQIDYQTIIQEAATTLLASFGFVYAPEESESLHGMYTFGRVKQGHHQRIMFHRRHYGADYLGESILDGSDRLTEVHDGLGGHVWISNRYIGVDLYHDNSSNTLTKFGVGTYNLRSELGDEPINFESRRVIDLVDEKEWWEFTNEKEFRESLQDILKIIRLFAVNWFRDCISQPKMKNKVS